MIKSVIVIPSSNNSKVILIFIVCKSCLIAWHSFCSLPANTSDRTYCEYCLWAEGNPNFSLSLACYHQHLIQWSILCIEKFVCIWSWRKISISWFIKQATAITWPWWVWLEFYIDEYLLVLVLLWFVELSWFCFVLVLKFVFYIDIVLPWRRLACLIRLAAPEKSFLFHTTVTADVIHKYCLRLNMVLIYSLLVYYFYSSGYPGTQALFHYSEMMWLSQGF